jgi:hypothetical protein
MEVVKLSETSVLGLLSPSAGKSAAEGKEVQS